MSIPYPRGTTGKAPQQYPLVKGGFADVGINKVKQIISGRTHRSWLTLQNLGPGTIFFGVTQDNVLQASFKLSANSILYDLPPGIGTGAGPVWDGVYYGFTDDATTTYVYSDG